MSGKVAIDNQIWRLEQQTDAYMQTTASRWSGQMEGRKEGKETKRVGLLVEVAVLQQY